MQYFDANGLLSALPPEEVVTTSVMSAAIAAVVQKMTSQTDDLSAKVSLLEAAMLPTETASK